MIHQPLSPDGVHPQITSSLRLLVFCLVRPDLFVIYYCLFIISKNSLLSLTPLTNATPAFFNALINLLHAKEPYYPRIKSFRQNRFCPVMHHGYGFKPLSSEHASTLYQTKKCLDVIKLKALTDDKINLAQIMISVFDRVEKILEKGENAGFKRLLSWCRYRSKFRGKELNNLQFLCKVSMAHS